VEEERSFEAPDEAEEQLLEALKGLERSDRKTRERLEQEGVT